MTAILTESLRMHGVYSHPITVSIEWDADDNYLYDFLKRFYAASFWFWNATMSQLAISQVSLFINAENWEQADIQVWSQYILADAAVLGIRANRGCIRLAPYDRAEVICHELGHYYAGVFDEYQKPNGFHGMCSQCVMCHNSVLMFCSPHNHDYHAQTDQQRIQRASCWETISHNWPGVVIP